MSKWPATMMKPTGWFQIGWSTDFEVGAAVPKRYFGEDLAIFRTETGVLRVLDAYCPHMGAHLARGGTICGEMIACPFHGWEWDGEGQNVRIPYQDRPNRAVRVRSWPVIERNDIVYVWHDRNGGEPTWNPLDVFDALGADVAAAVYHPAHPDGQIRYGARRLTPFMVLDNVADPAHFLMVHDSSSIPIVVSSEPDGHLFRVKLGFGKSWVTDPDTTTADALDVLQIGVGVSFTALGSTTHPFVVIVLSTTPIDDETSELFQTVWLQQADGDEQPGRLAERMHRATNQLPRDIEIWEHQRYIERPAWAANEVRGFTALRRWASEFWTVDDAPATR